ncbi:M23 family metallopeptidase [Clostridium aestuarii]|uniref:M23 family metallopeptidase n=1 Tax=Clostridium aestuarii TaxID=338193 RepID=A0ABT4D326_9CLOT|nr:M23 family metallopeptidase [Clostridium aestuarii]MCY6485634.1 M23 family metallopeptidase [Clostridium aestuarii]
MKNKDSNKKLSNFFRREGFYVVLFVSLCIIAVFAALTTRNNKVITKNSPVLQEEQKGVPKKENNISKALVENEKQEFDNALRVENSKKEQKQSNKPGIAVIKSKEEIAVSKVKEHKFIKPVEGEVVMKYSTTPIWWDTTESYRPNFGIAIKTKANTPVKAVADGEVKSVGYGDFGMTVVIYHSEYGKSTMYGNLAKDVKVKKGDKVKQGNELGKIGATAVRGSKEKYGKDFLHLEMYEGSKIDDKNKCVNPEKYIKY